MGRGEGMAVEEEGRGMDSTDEKPGMPKRIVGYCTIWDMLLDISKRAFKDEGCGVGEPFPRMRSCIVGAKARSGSLSPTQLSRGSSTQKRVLMFRHCICKNIYI